MVFPYLTLKEEVLFELTRAGVLQHFEVAAESFILKETLANTEFNNRLQGQLGELAQQVLHARRAS